MRQNRQTLPAVEDHLEKLDQLLELEESKTGKRVFKRGPELRHGLIDVKGVMDVISQQKASISQVSSEAQIAQPLQSKRTKSTDKTAWKKALKAMAKDPALLLEAVPSTWEAAPLSSQLDS